MVMAKLYVKPLAIKRCAQLEVAQWWDAGQQTNRPHGWAFSKIKTGVIRDMKLWKVRQLRHCSPMISNDASAHWLELCNKRLLKPTYIQQSHCRFVQHYGGLPPLSMCTSTNALLVFPIQYVGSTILQVGCFFTDSLVQFSRDGMHIIRTWALFSIVDLAASGFSAGGTDILFENNLVQNGDDCLTVGNGAKNIHWRSVYIGSRYTPLS